MAADSPYASGLAGRGVLRQSSSRPRTSPAFSFPELPSPTGTGGLYSSSAGASPVGRSSTSGVAGASGPLLYSKSMHGPPGERA